MKTLILTPTYNERGNIEALINQIQAQTREEQVSILVIDSNSPDGTGEIIDILARNRSGVYALHQPSKQGLGKAYLDGFRWALDKGFEVIFTMDADFSHDPVYIPSMLREIERVDLVIGSRYVRGGGVVNWPWPRRVVSRFGNWYAKTIMGIQLNDFTSGFQCFRAKLLEKILSPPVSSEGYVFLIELKFRASMEKARIFETPIIFKDRTRGESKISKGIIREAAVRVWQFAKQKYVN